MSKQESATTALRTFTAVDLTIDIGDERQISIEAESIFDVPAAWVQRLVAEDDNTPATISHNLRHGELRIEGDTRRWFLHQVRYTRYYGQVEEKFIIVTAD